MTSINRTAAPPKSSQQIRTSDGLPLLGMHPDKHAGALPPNAFIYLKNVRRNGGDITVRGGQQLICDFGQGNPVTGLGDLAMGKVKRLITIGDGCPGVSPTAGHYMGSFASEQSPTYNRLVYQPAATSVTMARFKKDASRDGLLPPVDGLFFSIDNALYRLENIPFVYGADPFVSTGGALQKLVWTAPDTYSRISAVIQHGGVLLVAVVGAAGGGAGTSAVYSWDGLTWRVDRTGINPITGFAPFRDMVVAGYDGAPNAIHPRSTAGVWSSVAPSAGTIKILGANRCESFEDQLYMPNGEDIFRWDGGATATRIPVGTTGITAGATIFAVKRAFGYLFADWSATAVPENKIARFDSETSTWDPAHYDLYAQDDEIAESRAMEVFQGCLLVAVTTSAGGVRLFRSQPSATSLAYESVQSSAVYTGDLTEMLIF